MPLVDRATNILPLLVDDNRLAHGDIAFVTHSFGGLILQQLLRVASDRSAHKPRVADFLRRVSRVAFLGTPHRGASLATWAGVLRFLVFPSPATKDLARNNPHLRDLHRWFQQYAADTGLAIRTLIETKPMFRLLVVPPESADLGLPSDTVPVDANHFGIASPASKTSETYVHIKNFVTAPRPTSHRKRLVDHDILGRIAAATSTTATAIEHIEHSLHLDTFASPISPALPATLADAETLNRLCRLRRSRFFVGAEPAANAARFAEALLTGDLAHSSPAIRARSLAWCARILLSLGESTSVPECLEISRRLADTEELSIAEAFAQSRGGDLEGALARLSKSNSHATRSAAFIAVKNYKTSQDALAWLTKSGLTPAHLDSDGRLLLILTQLNAGLLTDAVANSAALTPDDFEQAPSLWYIAATAHLATAVPRELATLILSQPPFTMIDIPLADDVAALEKRRIAQRQYARAAEVAANFDYSEASHDAADRALVLRLRDPHERDSALAELHDSMRLAEHSLRRLPIALQCGLTIDLRTAEQNIDRAVTLSAGRSRDAALARLALALKKTPKECALYIQRYRSELGAHLNPAFLAHVEIQAQIDSGQLSSAEERLRQLPSDDVSDDERARLSQLVADARASNPTTNGETQFKATDRLIDLQRLVATLQRDGDWVRLVKYAALLFQRVRDLASLSLYARALWETANFQGILDLLHAHDDLLSRSDELQSILAWSLYNLGHVTACQKVLATLRDKRDTAADRNLFVNLAIASGDWDSLAAFVERDWERRPDRSATDLLHSGQLAQQVGSRRAPSLVAAAAAKAPTDPHLLLGCYASAVAGGWEDEDTFKWFERAAALSTAAGPIQRLSLKELVDRHPNWQRHEAEAWDKLHAGVLPISGCAHILNRSLVELSLLPAVANTDAIDPRRRTLLYAYSGSRHVSSIVPHSIIMDPTALLNAGLLALLEPIVAALDKVVIPHSTLGWLFEERQRIRFHQPSRVSDARELRRLVDAGVLKPLRSSVPTDDDLAREIGYELARLFGEAESNVHSDRRPRRVVRSAPIPRVASLMEEEADLGPHGAYVCGCLDVVDALVQEGRLTQMEERRARAFLGLHEKPWPQDHSVSSGTVLYMDSVSLSYFQHLELLPKFESAGLSIVIAAHALADADRLIGYEALTERVIRTIDHIRAVLHKGIIDGAIILAPQVPNDGVDDNGLDHPAIDVIRIATLADAVVIDDRYFNRHPHVSSDDGTNTPVLTTYDLLFALGLPKDHRNEHLAHIRRACFAFVPLDRGELDVLLSQAGTANGSLVETAELRALRENIQLCRMSTGLQLPGESNWLENFIRVLLDTIEGQWRSGSDLAVSAARSTWLLALLDIRGWCHRYARSQEHGSSVLRFRALLLRLMLFTADTPPYVRAAYWDWLDRALLSAVREGHSDLEGELIQDVSTLVEKIVTFQEDAETDVNDRTS